MDLRWYGSVALVAVIGVAALFLFPMAHGSFSATHGPTTPLRSGRFRAVLMFLIAAAGSLLAQLLAPGSLLSPIHNHEQAAAVSAVPPILSPLRR
jgi:hypothetical protein